MHQLIEKLAVVRDHQDRPRITLQIPLHPDQRLQIQVVGWLIEHQQIRLLHEQPREVCAHDPAAAHLGSRPVKIASPKTQAPQNALGLGLQLPATGVVVQLVRLRLHMFAVKDLFTRLEKSWSHGQRQFQHRLVIHR